jgi:hypothetical protein
LLLGSLVSIARSAVHPPAEPEDEEPARRLEMEDDASQALESDRQEDGITNARQSDRFEP